MVDVASAIEAATATQAVAAFSNCTATVGGVSVAGIFDDAYTDTLNFSGSFPALSCASADVSTAAQGAAVVVNGSNYTVAAVKPDRTGMTLLQLAEA
jgi:hypothetical protein